VRHNTDALPGSWPSFRLKRRSYPARAGRRLKPLHDLAIGGVFVVFQKARPALPQAQCVR